MKVIELIALLDQCDPDAEVRLATQPNWPLQSHVHGVWNAAGDEHGALVYITEGNQVSDDPYAPRMAWDMAEVI